MASNGVAGEDCKVKLEDKIVKKTARVGVIGLGYVGLPLAVEFAKAGFLVTGIDVDEERVAKVREGSSYVGDVSDEDLRLVISQGSLTVTAQYDATRELDAILVCVPTPFTKSKKPDISYIISATREIAGHLRPGQLVILKSTTYPGTTQEEMLPILESSGLKVGEDFFLAFSPERVDPGNQKYTIKSTPVLVGGVTERCTQLAKMLQEQIIERVHPVSSPRVAEMAKLLENIFRSVNIALVNELAQLCDRMGIDVWEVVEAAATKPFGFMPFRPGPGVGGHCIPVDPYYLSWKAREYDFHTNFIELAAETNENMPYYVVSKITSAINDMGKSISDAKILALGVAYKPDIYDFRLSSSLKIIELLQDRGADILYNDPYIPTINNKDKALESSELTKSLLKEMDCVVILTDHAYYDYEWIAQNSRLIVDTRNATKGISSKGVSIVKI